MCEIVSASSTDTHACMTPLLSLSIVETNTYLLLLHSSHLVIVRCSYLHTLSVEFSSDSLIEQVKFFGGHLL